MFNHTQTVLQEFDGNSEGSQDNPFEKKKIEVELDFMQTEIIPQTTTEKASNSGRKNCHNRWKKDAK